MITGSFFCNQTNHRLILQRSFCGYCLISEKMIAVAALGLVFGCLFLGYPATANPLGNEMGTWAHQKTCHIYLGNSDKKFYFLKMKNSRWPVGRQPFVPFQTSIIAGNQHYAGSSFCLSQMPSTISNIESDILPILPSLSVYLRMVMSRTIVGFLCFQNTIMMWAPINYTIDRMAVAYNDTDYGFIQPEPFMSGVIPYEQCIIE